MQCEHLHTILCKPFYSSVRLTVAEAETDNKYTEPIGNLCCYLSLCNVYTFTQSYATHFLSVSASISATTSLIEPSIGLAIYLGLVLILGQCECTITEVFAVVYACVFIINSFRRLNSCDLSSKGSFTRCDSDCDVTVSRMNTHWYPRSGGSKGARPSRPPLGQIFFIFMQFPGKIGQIIGWRPLGGWCTPSGRSWIRQCT